MTGTTREQSGDTGTLAPQYSALVHVHGETWEEALQELERAVRIAKAEGPCVGSFQEGKTSVFLSVNRNLGNWLSDTFKGFKKFVSRRLSKRSA